MDRTHRLHLNRRSAGATSVSNACLGLMLAAACLALAVAAPRAAQAQSAIIVTSNPAPAFVFGQTLTFSLAAHGPNRIISAILHLHPASRAPIAWRQVSFTPSTAIQVSAELDPAQAGLPAFSSVTYWWVLTDDSGSIHLTEPAEFLYEDNRFNWARLSAGLITVHWYEGSDDFGKMALVIAADALAVANRDVRAPLPERIDIYIYANDADVQASLRLSGHSWAGGHADPELGVVIVAVPPDAAAELGLLGAIPHELTHVLVFKRTDPNYPAVPSWLDEGLALMNQTRAEPGLAGILATARDSNQIIDLETLCGPFISERIGLAYAQSESVVHFIRLSWGSEGVHRLLAAYAGGAGCSQGVELALEISLAELERGWLEHAVLANSPRARRAAMAPWLLISGLIALGPLLFFALTLRRTRMV